jgi:hypothetical protein
LIAAPQLAALQQLLLVQSSSTLHPRPVPQVFGVGRLIKAHDPPQSGPVSLPFIWVSSHSGGRHLAVVPSQTRLRQSEFATHFCPVLQRCVHVTPPQFTSVSLPFCARSEQFGGKHFLVTESQTLLWQSTSVRQLSVSAHAGHPPPQSTSVSVSLSNCKFAHVGS